MILVDIGVALIFAKILGYISERFKQPSVIGEIIAGIILGKYFLGFIMDELLHAPNLYPFDFNSSDFQDIAHLGIIFLLFISGLGTDLGKVKSTVKVAMSATIGGVLTPFILGFISGKLLGYADGESLVIGVILTATSVGVSARTMMDLGVLKTDVGTATLSASVMDDVLGLVMIILVTGSGNVFDISLNIIIFFSLTYFIGVKLIRKVMELADSIHTTKALSSISIGICLLFAAFSEFTLSTAIIGSYFAGLFISTTSQSKRIVKDIKTIGFAVFIPLFFVYIGSIVNLGVFLKIDVLILSFVILIVAIVGKVFGRGFGAYLAKMPVRKSLQIGVGSIPRMEIALVSMSIAIREGIISGNLADKFIGATFIFVIVTTIITPPLIKWSFKDEIETVIQSQQ